MRQTNGAYELQARGALPTPDAKALAKTHTEYGLTPFTLSGVDLVEDEEIS